LSHNKSPSGKGGRTESSAITNIALGYHTLINLRQEGKCPPWPSVVTSVTDNPGRSADFPVRSNCRKPEPSATLSTLASNLRCSGLESPRSGRADLLSSIPWKTLQKKVLPDFRDLPYMPAKAPGTGVRG